MRAPLGSSRSPSGPAGIRLRSCPSCVRALRPSIPTSVSTPSRRCALSKRAVARERFYAVILVVFALVAAILAVIGVAVSRLLVVQRTQEIGVRMALGAQRGQVLRLILRRGLGLATIGIVAGLIGAFAAARYLQSMLFGIEPLDPMTFAGVAVAFALVAAAAAYLPARRATRVDPMVALRVE